MGAVACAGLVEARVGYSGADMAACGFPPLLKAWRQKRRLSQLDLALTAGVSQRHVSFLESGRASPSRGMILHLSEALEVPLRERNALLTAAGYAPVFSTRALADPHMGQVMGAVRMMLAAHAPFPGVALDRAWNICLANSPFERMEALFGADIWQRMGGGTRNLLRLFFHPAGIRQFITNWAEIGPLLWRRAQREAQALGGEDMAGVLAELAPFQDGVTLAGAADAVLVPVIPFSIDKDGVRLALFGVIASFGTAQDVTADELRIELLFPADAGTEGLLRAAGAGKEDVLF